MKNLFNVTLIVFLFSFGLNAQSFQEVAQAKSITWFGLDFSHTKLIGNFTQFDDKGEKTGQEIRDKYFTAWNNLLLKEKEKYDFQKPYKKDQVEYDLDIVQKRNSAVNADAIYSQKSEDKNKLTKEEIEKIIKEYNSAKKGIGLVYIVDNFDKNAEEGVMWVTFFDIPSRKVLLTERFSGKPGGFGIKNYWARSVLEVIEDSGKEYKTWIKKSK
jgi:hypothetical protein